MTKTIKEIFTSIGVGALVISVAVITNDWLTSKYGYGQGITMIIWFIAGRVTSDLGNWIKKQ